MERETVESARLATSLALIGVLISVALIAFGVARKYGGEFFNNASEQQRNATIVGLSSLARSGGTDMPTAALYSIIIREWRNVESVTLKYVDSAGNALTYAYGEISDSTGWDLYFLDNSSEVKRISGPEEVLYANPPSEYGQFLSGRVYVTVTIDPASKAYNVDATRLEEVS